MNTESKDIERTFPVPLDMLMDILKIVLTNSFANQVMSINVIGNVVWLKVKFPAGHLYAKEARENIETLLTDYGYFTGNAPDYMNGVEQNF